MVCTGGGDAFYIDWRAFKTKYGHLDAKRQGDVLDEISQCHEEQSLADGPIVKVEQPTVFTEAKDGRRMDTH
jgi:hypothetical protein